MGYINLREHAESARGLNEKQRYIDEMLKQIDDRLSLRRIPEGDPAFLHGRTFDPPRDFGVYEEGVQGGASPWVFTLPEMSVDERIIARVALGDMSKTTPKQRMEALMRAQAEMKLKENTEAAERQAELSEQAHFIANTSKTTIRHRINGEMRILGTDNRAVRSHF